LSVVDGFGIYTEHAATITYEAELWDSTFCLCPEGWVSWTSRLFHVMPFGCVPVLFSEPGAASTRLPFDDVLDWDQLVVRVNASRGPDPYGQVPQMLRSLSQTCIRRKQAALARISRMFLYHQDQAPSSPLTSQHSTLDRRPQSKMQRQLNAVTMIMAQLAEKASS
jgi:hypothetical protein